MEFWRPPNAATVIVFPILNSSGVQTSGASSLDSEFMAWSDATGPDTATSSNGNGFADCSNETEEIGATGLYALSLVAGELPAASPYVAIQVKSSLATQFILINTATQYVDMHRWRGSSPLVLSSGRVDGTVGAMQADVLTAAATNVNLGSEFADALLGRNVAGGSSGGREVREALAVLRNKVEIAAGTMTVYGTDDSSSLWTATVATVSNTVSVVTIDPA